MYLHCQYVLWRKHIEPRAFSTQPKQFQNHPADNDKLYNVPVHSPQIASRTRRRDSDGRVQRDCSAAVATDLIDTDIFVFLPFDTYRCRPANQQFPPTEHQQVHKFF